MWEIRTITSDDAELFRRRLARGFGSDADQDESAMERFEATHDYERTFAAFDGDDIVGTGGALSLGLTVPGGDTVPMGGTTIVTVQPTHRRRGILRELMSRHLDEVAGREEPIAGLWASEGSIYGRFGYGPATGRHNMSLDTAKIVFRDASSGGSGRLLESEEAAEVLPALYERARRLRSGMLTRSDAWWEHRVLADPDSRRGGKSAKRYLVVEVDGEASGYVIYRQKSKWEDFVADGEVDVEELITLDASAHRQIWEFLTNVDLFPRVEWWNAPVDDPLPLMVTDSRRVRRSVSDALWIRLMDVPRALQARNYFLEGALTIGVVDGFRSDGGVFRLEVSDTRGRCVATDADPELEMGLDVLGHLYLGGGDARAMAAAGRIEGDLGAVERLDRMFRTDVAPWCPEVF